jgi:hypothetical protein
VLIHVLLRACCTGVRAQCSSCQDAARRQQPDMHTMHRWGCTYSWPGGSSRVRPSKQTQTQPRTSLCIIRDGAYDTNRLPFVRVASGLHLECWTHDLQARVCCARASLLV